MGEGEGEREGDTPREKKEKKKSSLLWDNTRKIEKEASEMWCQREG